MTNSTQTDPGYPSVVVEEPRGQFRQGFSQLISDLKIGAMLGIPMIVIMLFAVAVVIAVGVAVDTKVSPTPVVPTINQLVERQYDVTLVEGTVAGLADGQAGWTTTWAAELVPGDPDRHAWLAGTDDLKAKPGGTLIALVQRHGEDISVTYFTNPCRFFEYDPTDPKVGNYQEGDLWVTVKTDELQDYSC